jgi:hypothetical protein
LLQRLGFAIVDDAAFVQDYGARRKRRITGSNAAGIRTYVNHPAKFVDRSCTRVVLARVMML